MVHIYGNQGYAFDDIKSMMNDELKSADGWYRAYLDCALCDIMVKEGDYQTAVQELESRSRHYKNSSVEVMMLAEMANISGNRLDDKATAKAYADRAAAINPGQSVLRVAYNAAGMSYKPSEHENRLSGVAETFDTLPEPETEPVASQKTTVSASPNPANPVSTISYNISDGANVKLTIYSVSGQKVATLVDGFMPAGKHAATFDGANLASGVYFYQFVADGFAKTGKMVLVK